MRFAVNECPVTNDGFFATYLHAHALLRGRVGMSFGTYFLRSIHVLVRRPIGDVDKVAEGPKVQLVPLNRA